MKVLVGCERFGKVRDAFRFYGHDAYSCDIEPDVKDSPYHIQDSLFNHLYGDWDLGIFFPPCTYLCSSGARWMLNNPPRWRKQLDALFFVNDIWTSPIPKIAIENPKGVLSGRIGKPTQIIQPWMFGHGETKETHLWLKGLKPLEPTEVVEGRENRIHKMAPSGDRGVLRSVTYDGVAEAMALQWGV